MRRISKGAEADIYLIDGLIKKARIAKAYRVESLDRELRKTRTKREAKLISLARRAGVATPFVYDVDVGSNALEMEHIDGVQVKKILDTLSDKERDALCRAIGEDTGRLHSANLVHGDLTTSNMILREGRVYFIDFGLGEISENIEDKGVDILVFKKALYSTHHSVWEKCFEKFTEGYASEYDKSDDVLARLRSIERRGRYFAER